MADEPGLPSALPSRGARILAFAAILIGGLCGGLIGFSIARLQCVGDCTTSKSLAGLFGAIFGALGVAVIAVLALRAMGEWKTIQEREEAGQGRGTGQARPNDSRRKPSV